ncbi:hypothetical protein QM806_36565 [Rhodococcus sp. IEGM 1351]|uniref:hypothetical protein n=1 Tax=Rhodococcus sp. IEGM 1351 TaxID=3047089 RepID=UPI0024B87635|nr:hypothetical protein [Rhodococcus sp. IEGM 1351]MDI9940876.1 hypothetical protein [Rhodococcus sp. IEGM 1351]
MTEENNAPNETPDDQQETPKVNKEARYRTERNEARTERDSLAERIERLQTRELERVAAKHLSVPADLLTLSGKTLADLLDDDGDVDPEKVAAVAVEVLGARPGLKPNDRATDPSQGHGSHGRGTPRWGDLLR